MGDERTLSDAEIDVLVEANRVRGYIIVFDIHTKWVHKSKSGPVEAPPGETPGCWLGGKPTLPPEIEWPFFRSHWQKADMPMVFLGQIDCARLSVIEERPEIPRVGTLFLFYDPVFDEEHSGEGRIIYVVEDVSRLPYREAPPRPEALDWDAMEYSVAEPEDPQVLPKYTFTPIRYDEFSSIGDFTNGVNDRAYIDACKRLEADRGRKLSKVAANLDEDEWDNSLFGALSTVSWPDRKKLATTTCIAKFFRCYRLFSGFTMEGACLNFMINNEERAKREFW